jgi:hypothetical protein
VNLRTLRPSRLIFTGVGLSSVLGLAGCGISAIAGALVASSVASKDSTTAQTPRPVAVTTPTVSVNDRVPISFTLSDPSIPMFDVLVEYSADGPTGTFNVATEALGAPSQGTVSLAAASAGVPHVFVWNAFYDLDRRQIGQSPDVIVRVSAFPAGVAAVTTNTQGRHGEAGVTSRFTVDDRLIATIAGTSATDGEGIPASSVPLNGPACAVVTSGAVVVADTGGHRVRRADQITKIVTTSAGSAAPGRRGDRAHLDHRGHRLGRVHGRRGRRDRRAPLLAPGPRRGCRRRDPPVRHGQPRRAGDRGGGHDPHARGDRGGGLHR